MLIGIDPLLTPELLHALASMGHGDTIALVDANYPASRGKRLIRLPGVTVAAALRATLTVLPLDDQEKAAQAMLPAGDAVPAAVAEINAVLAASGARPAAGLGRHEFYAAAEQAYAIVATGERRRFGNVLLVKGVVAADG